MLIVLEPAVGRSALTIGAHSHERTDARTTERNGRRSRGLTTAAGDLELKIPKVREDSFLPSLLERRRRIDQAFFAVVMEAYVTGTSVRKVDNLVKVLGVDTGISKSEISRICADLDEHVASFAGRDLKGVEPLTCSSMPHIAGHASKRAPNCRSMAVSPWHPYSRFGIESRYRERCEVIQSAVHPLGAQQLLGERRWHGKQ